MEEIESPPNRLKAGSGFALRCMQMQIFFVNSFFPNNFLWPQAWSLNPLPEVFTYVGRAAGFEPELVKLAALPRSPDKSWRDADDDCLKWCWYLRIRESWWCWPRPVWLRALYSPAGIQSSTHAHTIGNADFQVLILELYLSPSTVPVPYVPSTNVKNKKSLEQWYKKFSSPNKSR
jgi:hypothetical protein